MAIPRLIRNLGLAGIVLLLPRALRADRIWIEGEKPTEAHVHRQPEWYDQVNTEQLSGGAMISNWDEKQPGLISYTFLASRSGEFEFWARANPAETKLYYKLNDGPWLLIDMSKAQEKVNIAADGKFDLRFLAWVRADQVDLRKGSNTIQFRMDSINHHHGMLDCFVLSSEPFQPGKLIKKSK